MHLCLKSLRFLNKLLHINDLLYINFACVMLRNVEWTFSI